ncbi:MAG: AAA family ATPase [Candidatus Limnocylindria bacterium]
MARCPRCGRENPDDARYCAGCGIELAPSREAARKTVTVVFCDLVGSTSLGEQVDPEAVRRAMARYFEAARAGLEGHGGTIEKYIGDAVMAVFGIPQVHEDDALRAVKAAADIRERVTALGGQLADELGHRLEIRIGVNTGEVVAADSTAGHAFVTGDAVNVAARLEQSAEPGDILLGERTYELVRHSIVAERSNLTLRGKSLPVAAWRLLDIGVAPLDRHALRGSPLVARREELAMLSGVLDRVIASRSCQVGTIIGEPGIGKSRLARELVDVAGEGCLVVTGQCLSYGEGITFWPLVEIVRQLTPGDDGLETVLAGDPDAVLIAARIRGALGTAGSPGPAEETAWAFRRLFERVARQRPVIMVVDDLHWAEPTLLDLLEYVIGFTTDAPLLLLCLARPEFLEQRPAWANRNSGALLMLEPLADRDAAALVDGLISGAALSKADRGRLVSTAEGNPLFLEQIVAHRLEHRDEEAVVPPSVEALLAARIDLLKPPERATIVRASVEGRDFHRGAVVELLGADAAAAIDSSLDSLVRKGLIEPRRPELPDEVGYRFGHQLIRDAAYAAAPKELRADLHRRYADWLERRVGDGGTEYEEIIGYHLEQAYRYLPELRQPDAELGYRAGERLGRAGERALARGDASAARNLLERATELGGDHAPPVVWHALGVARLQGGDFALADEALLTAAARADDLGDERAAARAALERAGLTIWTGGMDPDGLQAAVERAIATLEPLQDELGLAKAWLTLVQVHNGRLEIAKWERAATRALGHARLASSPADEAQAIMWRCAAMLLGVTPIGEAIAVCNQILTEAHGPLAETAVLQIVGPLRMMAGDVAEGRALFDRATELHLDLGMKFMAAIWTTARALGELGAAEFQGAEAFLRGSIATLEEMGERGALSTQAVFLAHALCALKRYDEAVPYLDMSAEMTEPQDLVNQILIPAGRARVLAAAGDSKAAVRMAREAVELVDRTDATDMRALARTALAEAFRAADRPQDEGATLREALALYEFRGLPAHAALARERLAELRAVAASS